MRRLLAIILVCALIAGVGVGCKKAEVLPTEQVVNLGGIFPMTGGSATFGTSSKNGVVMAVDEFNAAGGAMVDGVKTTINYINEDDTGSPEVGASAAQKLIDQDKVIGIIGAVMSKVTLAVAPICQAAGVPMISPTSTNAGHAGRRLHLPRLLHRPVPGYRHGQVRVEHAEGQDGRVLYDNGNDYTKGLAEFFKAGL